jgi:hypothetical protein
VSGPGRQGGVPTGQAQEELRRPLRPGIVRPGRHPGDEGHAGWPGAGPTSAEDARAAPTGPG